MQSASANESTADHCPGKVLVVDDDPNNLRIVTAILRDKDFEVDTADSGREAVARVLETPPDLILLDLIMPKVDGYETLKLLQSLDNFEDIPVIFLSGARELKNQIIGLELGAVDFISKPIEPEALIARVGTHLRMSFKIRQLKLKIRELQSTNMVMQNRIAHVMKVEQELATLKSQQQVKA